jgi:hypothetical protein
MERGNATDEIEITPEMIEAGVRAYFGPNAWYDPLPSELVECVYRAMAIQALRSNRSGKYTKVGSVVMSRMEDIAKGLASVGRGAACAATPDWARSITLTTSLFGSELLKRVECTSMPCRVAVLGELVRIDFDFNVIVSTKNDLAHLLRLEIEPFIIGVGEVRVEDAPKGVIIRKADLGIMNNRH